LTKEKSSKKENTYDDNDDVFYFYSFTKLKVICHVSSLLWSESRAIVVLVKATPHFRAIAGNLLPEKCGLLQIFVYCISLAGKNGIYSRR
jgi:hypothetical protein